MPTHIPAMTRIPACLGRVAAVPLLAAALCLTPGLVRAEPYEYVIDPEHTAVAFSVRHLGFADVLGRFLEVAGSFTFDEEARTLSDVTAEIQAASVTSDHAARDDHLRKKDFLWVGEHPEIRFTGTGAEPTGERTGKVFGDLTIRGVTQPVVLDVTWNRSGRYPFGDKHYAIGISARTSIKRSDFGMTYALEGDMVGDEVDIVLEFEAIRQE
ncbi:MULTISPECIES: YceI family protein [Thalassobaculum]|uniref:Polyisoprenoid-binding protein YceI n=1 Tax=Thalassobaculum litoreum DSM 18839 TaxID=1123362 RepID=A0A8G2F2X6_9PROT|nr:MULTISPECIES: YceI family protein [Thalassobaculum]SDF68978.1 Polyisoprenoid-binding protein YceI [Thalassobaculum litoreum DSM 18839]